MGARAARAVSVDGRSDADLAADAAAGNSGAFEELYRRHSPAAWRVAYAVTGNRDDAADAVADAFTRVLQALPAGRLADGALIRSYLLTATRNAAIDVSRRGGRVRVTDELDSLDDGTRVSTPTDRLTEKEDSSIIARAFRSLPERWRSVLWLTEVEGIAPREAALLLGVTPNNAAQLAVRARAGLRERFVQGHLTGRVAAGCEFTVERLGAYVTGRLAPRDLAKVDQHLAGCAACASRREQLEDVGRSLRRIVVPLPVLLAPAALENWKLAFAAGHAAATTGAVAPAGRVAEIATRVQRPLMAVSTGIFAVGVIIAAPNVLGSGGDGGRAGGERTPLASRGTTPPTPAVVPPGRVVTISPASFTTRVEELVELPRPTAVTPTTTTAPAAPPQTSPDGGTPGTGPGGGDPEPEPPLVELGVAVVAGPVSAGAVAGDACLGGELLGETAGSCTPPKADAETAGVTVQVESTVLPAQDITIAI